ncbi:MAG: SH3 domain-containing protein [Flavobacteriaceae bacterium]|nr:SH3 domain-containing protein [Flavobacteriaceae bacterium]
MRLVFINICCWLMAFSALASQGSQDSFASANQAYNEGKYQDAITLYESILDEGMHSAELYFNLGNAYYKMNQVAPSIYFYEKALLLDPRDKEIQRNLSFAENMTIDSIEEIPEVGFSKLVNGITSVFSYDGWAIFSVATMILFVLFFLVYYFSISTTRKRILFLGSFVMLGLSILSLATAFREYDMTIKDNPAIVFAQESEVHSDPNLRSESVFNLHEGTKVQVLESYNDDWSKIRLKDGKTGWIPTEDIKLLNFF